MRAPSSALPLLALTGLGWAVVEALAAGLAPWPLDPELSLAAALGGGLALAGALAGLGLALRRWPALSAGPLAVWAALWAPELARVVGVPAIWGALAVGLVVALWRWRPAAASVLTLAGALALVALRPRVDLAPIGAPPAGPSVLLLTVDTVRADAGLLDGPDSPVGEGWWRFPLAYAPAPWTLPSMHSLMSGLPVVAHGGGLAAGPGYTAREAPSFVEALASSGWATSAFVCNPHLRASQGFAAGFQRFWHDDDAREPALLGHLLDRRLAGWLDAPTRLRRTRDDRLVEAALTELAAPSDRPRLVWVHLLGPHEYRRHAETSPRGWAPGTRDPAALAAAYQGNVGAARARLRRLVEAAPGWAVLISSDHGEAFGEGGHHGHGHALQDAELRVPLAIRAPGDGGGWVPEAVSTADAARTLLAIAGAPGASAFPGRDLRGAERSPVLAAGVRDDPQAAAARDDEGAWTPSAPPRLGPAAGLSAEEREALKQLGYTF